MTGMESGGGGASSAPPIDSSSIKRECIRHTHQNLISIFVSVAIGAAFLLYVLADKIGSTHILAWFAAILSCTALRLWFYLAFRRHARETFDPVFWGRLQSFLTIMSGIIWGAAPLTAYPRDSPSQQMFVALIAAGGAAGGTYAYAAMPRTAQAFLAATLFPIVAVNLAMGGVEHFPIGVMLAVYYLMLVIITKNNSRTVRSAITLALEKTALAEEMGKARDEADSAAEKLGVEIAERLKADENLRNSEMRFRLLVESSPFCIHEIGMDGNMLSMNKAGLDMLGLKEEKEVRGMSYLGAVSGEDKARIGALMREAFTGTASHFEFDSGGGDAPLRFKSCFVPIRGGDGAVIKLMGVTEDITERKAAEERLKAAKEEAEEATKLKDKFVSLVSHDLKNPLSTVNGFLRMLHLEYDDIGKDDAKAMIVSALEASNNMLHLIDDLLEISRIKTGQLRPRMSLTDLHFIADNSVMAYSNFAAGKLIEIKNEVPPKTAAYADQQLLLGVFKNLLSNALKFSREGGVVRIYLPEPGTVAVEDTGVGIPPSLLSHIFKYEVKTSTPGTRGERGTGFGLPLSYDIMKAHGGDLRVESEVGKGSTFYIILPPPPVF